MDKIATHYVHLEKSEEQPSAEHVVFIAGDIDPQLGVSVPFECLYLPLATWMGMACPEDITVAVKSGYHVPEEGTDEWV